MPSIPVRRASTSFASASTAAPSIDARLHRCALHCRALQRRTAGPPRLHRHTARSSSSRGVRRPRLSKSPRRSAKTGKKFTRKQFKNKWDFVKKDYVIWVELNNSATGLGRCSIRKTVDALNEWWNMQIGLNKEFAKFRDGPLANLECLEVMFDNTYVTSAIAIVPEMVLGGEASPILLEGSGSSVDPAGKELIGSGSKRKKPTKGKGKENNNKYFQEYKKAARAISSQCTPSIQSRGCPIPTIKQVIWLMIDCGAK